MGRFVSFWGVDQVAAEDSDVDRTLTPFSVLDKCDSFLLNDLVDSDAYASMY